MSFTAALVGLLLAAFIETCIFHVVWERFAPRARPVGWAGFSRLVLCKLVSCSVALYGFWMGLLP